MRPLVGTGVFAPGHDDDLTGDVLAARTTRTPFDDRADNAAEEIPLRVHDTPARQRLANVVGHPPRF